VLLELEDDGCGSDPTSTGGNGRRSMTERAALVGARCEYPPRENGTLVRLILPRVRP